MSWLSLFGSTAKIRRRTRSTISTESLEQRVLLAADIEWTLHKSADGLSPSAAEQELLWNINQARANPAEAGQFLADTTLGDIADDRAANNVDVDALRSEFNDLTAQPPLAFDARLHTAALEHTNDLIDRDAEDENGLTTRITDAGFTFTEAEGNVLSTARSSLNAYAAFNIDWDADQLDGLAVGRPNRANQMSTTQEFSSIGISIVEETDPGTSVGPFVVTETFANADDTVTDHFNQFVTGTVWDDLNDNGRYDAGEGISGVRVTPDTGNFFAITAAGGGYSIPVTEPGDWEVTFSNGVSATQSVSVNSGVSVLLDIERGALSNEADLRSEQFELLTTNANAGANVTHRWQLRNSGNANAGEFRVDFYLSRDDQFDPEDILVANETVSSLAAGTSTALTESSFSLPAGGSNFWSGDGEYRLIMEIDANNDINESSELNNIVSTSNSITVSGTNSNQPDLTGGSLTTTATTATAGSTVNYNWVVANDGNSAATEFFVDFYISEDATFDPNDQQLSRQMVDSLAGNATTGNQSVTLTLPASGNAFWRGDKPYFIIMDIDAADSISEVNESNNFVQSSGLDVTNTGSSLAELVGSTLTISPDQVTAGEQITVQWQADNTGGSLAGDFTVDFYISVDDVNDPTDRLLGTTTVQGLAANANTGLQSETLRLPFGGDAFWTGDGPYRILMEVDANGEVLESNEGNNFLASTDSVEVTDTDQSQVTLDIDGDQSFSALSDGILATRFLAGFTGDSLTNNAVEDDATRQTSDEIVNYLNNASAMLDVDGDGAREALTDGILILRYLAGFTGDTLVDGAVNQSGTRTTGEQVRTFLDGFAPGFGPRAFGPSAPKNNPGDQPDITSSTLQVVPPRDVNAGDTVSVEWNAINLGAADATAFQVSFFLSNNNTSDPGDLLVQSETVTSLLADGGDTGTLTTSFVLPGLNDSYYTGDGDYWVIMLLDDGNSLTESDEDNNLHVVAEPLNIRNTVPAAPELVPGTFRPITTTANAGTDIEIEWEVRNDGNASADNFRVNFFLSLDRSFNPGDRFLSAEEGITIAGNDTTGVLSRTISLPPVGDSFWQDDGTYELIMVVDTTNAANESNETNNTSAASGSVTVNGTTAPRADLTGGSVEPVVSDAQAGDTIQINRNILNVGSVAAEGFAVSYYLSLDGTFGPGDELIGSESVAGIAAGGSSGTTLVDVTLPGAGSAFWSGDGGYRILAVLDVGPDAAPGVTGAIDELNEGNNLIAASNLVNVTNTGAGSLDIDDDGEANALTDGILGIRYLAGFAGDSLVNGAVDDMGNRQSSDDIFAFLNSFRPQLDIDDDGLENALTDGILIIRYLAGFRGDSLIDGAVDQSGQRTSATEIEAYLESLIP